MLNKNKKVNTLQNCEACLHLLASKFPLTQVGMHYKSNQVAHIVRIQQHLNRRFERNISKLGKYSSHNTTLNLCALQNGTARRRPKPTATRRGARTPTTSAPCARSPVTSATSCRQRALLTPSAHSRSATTVSPQWCGVETSPTANVSRLLDQRCRAR